MSVAFLLSTLLMLGSAIGADARVDPITVAADDGPLSVRTADELAQIAFPDSVIALDLAHDRRFYADGCTADARMRALEQARPGICAAINAVALKELDTIYRQQLSLMRAEASAIYRDNLTESEGRQVISVLRSPAGNRMLLGYHQAAAGGPDQTIAGATATAEAAATHNLDAADQALLAQIETPEFQPKLGHIKIGLQAAAKRAQQRIDAAKAERIPPLVRRVIADFGKH